MSKVERVARAICFEAGRYTNKTYCPICEEPGLVRFSMPHCVLWKEFRNEARAAISAMEP